MKCNDAEKLILLKDSNELAEKRERGLAAHLHDCESCRKFQQVLAQSSFAYEAALEPSERTVQDVLRKARLNAPDKKRATSFGWKPAVAMASSLVIATGVFLSTIGPDKVGMVLVVSETQLMEPADQVVSIMYEGLSEDDLAFNFLMTDEGNG